MTREFAVKAETREGNTMTLRRGFRSREAAEDHPVTLSLWKRVWVTEDVGSAPALVSEATLPPLPWDWIAAGHVSNNNTFHAYLVDATGRKIAAIWGKEGEKSLIADHILKCVNGGTP